MTNDQSKSIDECPVPLCGAVVLGIDAAEIHEGETHECSDGHVLVAEFQQCVEGHEPTAVLAYTGERTARRIKAEPRVLLVGEANPFGGDPAFALYPEPRGASGDRLCRKIMGLRGGQYLRAFDRVNLCPHKWSVKVARVRAAEILAGPPRKALVLLGAKVRDTFGIGDAAPFNIHSVALPNGGQVSAVVLPHPSGLC